MGLRFAGYFVPSLDWFWLWNCTYHKLTFISWKASTFNYFNDLTRSWTAWPCFLHGFLYNIILRISRAPVSLFKTMASGSLLLACVIFWQVSFSFWNTECLLLLFISSGLMGLRLRHKETGELLLAGTVKKHIYKNKTILILLLIGTVTLRN